MTENVDLESVTRALRALRDVDRLELEAVARALGRTARPSNTEPVARAWDLVGPARPFARATFETRGKDDAFVVAVFELVADLEVSPAAVEPVLADLPFAHMPTHASFPTGPRITGFDDSFAVPAGELSLQFRDPPDALEPFGRATLERSFTDTVEGAPRPRTRLDAIVLGRVTSRFDPAFTLARMRQWAHDGGPWRG